MKIVKREEAERFENSEQCKVLEYGFNDKDIDISTATISGRYPSEGFCVNEAVKEMVYCLKGEGVIFFEGRELEFKAGDSILIDPGEKYYWSGNFELVMCCTPAWSKGQHHIII